MPSIYDLKPRFQALLRPLVGGLVRAGVTPNHVTLAALAGSIAAGAALVFAWRNLLLLLILPVWLLVRMALNAIDGMMAREHAMATPLGAVLNELGDVISDLALYLPLALAFPPAAIPIVAFSIGAVLTEFAGLLGVAIGAGRRYDGPMGKSDRALLVGLVAIATFIDVKILMVFGYWVFAAAALLTLVTVANRVRAALRRAAPESR